MHELRFSTPKTCSLDTKLFLEIEKKPVFNQMLLVFQRKEMHVKDPKVCIKS